jgi:uncharacterized Zn-finger protein
LVNLKRSYFKEFIFKQQRSHTGEKHYKCDICGKGYSNKIDCTRHIKSVHSTTHEIAKPPPPPPLITNSSDSGNSFNQQIPLTPHHLHHHNNHHSQSNAQVSSSSSSSNEINLVEFAYDYSGINNFALYQF